MRLLGQHDVELLLRLAQVGLLVPRVLRLVQHFGAALVEQKLVVAVLLLNGDLGLLAPELRRKDAMVRPRQQLLRVDLVEGGGGGCVVQVREGGVLLEEDQILLTFGFLVLELVKSTDSRHHVRALLAIPSVC